MHDLKNEAREMLDRAKERIQPIVEDAREKASPVIEDVKEKAAPAVARVRDIASGAVEAARDAAERIGDLFEEKGPGMNVKNDLFDSLEEDARARKGAAQDKAAELQRRLEELMGGKQE